MTIDPQPLARLQQRHHLRFDGRIRSLWRGGRSHWRGGGRRLGVIVIVNCHLGFDGRIRSHWRGGRSCRLGIIEDSTGGSAATGAAAAAAG